MKKTSLLYILAAVFIFFSACQTVPKESVPEENKKGYRLLIASEKSEFKDAIDQEVSQSLEKTCTIHHRRIEQLNVSDFKSDSYDAIIIMDSLKSWAKLNHKTRHMLEATDDKKKIVLLMTTGDDNWKFSYHDIDAITSASSMEKTEDVAGQILYRVDIALAK